MDKGAKFARGRAFADPERSPALFSENEFGES